MKLPVWLLLACATPLSAQTESLTLERAVSLAHARSPQIATASARRMTAEGRARAEAALPNPTFEWRQENIGSPLAPDLFATVQLPLDVTGRRLKLRGVVGDAVARGNADSAQAVRHLDYEVIRAYWRAALATELLASAREESAARARLATFDSGRFREGAVAEVVAIRTSLETNRARMSVSQAVREAEQARGELSRLLGVPADSLPRIAALPANPVSTEQPSLDAATAAALANRKDLASLRFAYSESQRRAAAEQRGFMSDLQLVSGYKKTSGFNSGVVGFALPMPIFSRNEGVIMRAQGERTIAGAELRDAELKVRAEVSAAVHSYAAIADAQRNGTTSLELQAQQIAQTAEGAYREGAISLIDLIEAQRTRAESRAAALRWRVELLLAQLELKRATGAAFMVNQ